MAIVFPSFRKITAESQLFHVPQRMARLACRCFRPRLARGWRATQACREGELGIDRMLAPTDCGYPLLPVVPARGGAEVALDFTIRPFSSIELACAVRPPGVVVQACVRACCCVQEHDLCAITLQCNTKRTFSSHFTLRFSQPALHTTHFTLHTSSHLISNHLISSHLMSPHLTSSHLIPSLLTCRLSKFFSTVFISFEHWKKFISTHLISSALQKDLTVRAKSFAQKNVKHTRLLHTEAWNTDAFTQKNLDNILCPTKLAQSTSQYYFVLHSLHKALPSTFYFVLTTKLAQSTSQSYTLRSATRESTNAKNHAHMNIHSLHRTQRRNRFDLETTAAASVAHRR